MSDQHAGQVSRWAFPVLCLIMAIGLLYLAYQNIQLKKQLAAVERKAPVAREVISVEPGAVAPPFEASLPDGQSLDIKTDSLSAPIIFAWMSYDCDPCLTALKPWNQLADQYPGQIFGLSWTFWEVTDTLFRPQDARFPILVPVADTVFSQYEISATPQTMVVLESGRIGYVSIGPLSTEVLDTIASLMQQPFIERR